MIEGLELTTGGTDGAGSGVARLTLDRPRRMNAISHAMWSAIPEIVAQVEADPAVRVLVLRGAGADFSAGADISEFGDLRSSAEGAAAYDRAVEGAVRALSGLRKPSIAMIRGNCIGGGCQLSVACDFRFATPGARFGITPAKLGIIYDFPSTRQLVSLIGPAHARYLLLTAELIDATRAREIGLLNEIHAEAELEDRVDAFAAILCSRSQTAVRGMNRIVEKVLAGQQETDAEVESLRLEALHGKDYAEGVAAFLGHRRPDFSHR